MADERRAVRELIHGQLIAINQFPHQCAVGGPAQKHAAHRRPIYVTEVTMMGNQ